MYGVMVQVQVCLFLPQYLHNVNKRIKYKDEIKEFHMKFQFINTFGLRERVAKCNCLGGTPFNTFWNSLELDPPTWEIAINFEICYPLPNIVERRQA